MEDLRTTVLDSQIDLRFYYGYYVIVFLIALYLILKENPKNKVELFLISFFLMTGNINEYLTIKIPGFSLFEIQPDRFLLFVFGLFLFRKVVISRGKPFERNWTVPLFMIVLYGYCIMITISQISHVESLGLTEVIINTTYTVNFLFAIWCMRMMTSKEVLAVIGTSVIVGGVATSIVSLIQLGYDPMFMRMGDQRPAFGALLRSNGIFSSEYFNAYFTIVALGWVLVTVKKGWLRFFLILLFSATVISSFQRMSWVILVLTLATYFLFIEKIALERLVLGGLAGLALALSVYLSFHEEIMNSSMVRERLTETIDSRYGYYSLAMDNVGRKPILGFGGRDNETYYHGMLMITRDRARAAGTTGGFHSGYFENLFYYGIPATLLFIGFVVFSIAYFGKLTQVNLFYVIPFLYALLYGVASLTNAFMFPKSPIVLLFAMHIGLGLGVRYAKENVIPDAW